MQTCVLKVVHKWRCSTDLDLKQVMHDTIDVIYQRYSTNITDIL